MFVKAGKNLIRSEDILSITYQINSVINIYESEYSARLDKESKLEVFVKSDNPKDGFFVNLKGEPYKLVITSEEGEKLIEFLYTLQPSNA